MTNRVPFLLQSILIVVLGLVVASCGNGPSEPTQDPVFSGSLPPLEASDLWISGHQMDGPIVTYAFYRGPFYGDAYEDHLVFNDHATVTMRTPVSPDVSPDSLVAWREEVARRIVGEVDRWLTTQLEDGVLVLLSSGGNFTIMAGESRLEAEAQIEHVLLGLPLEDLPKGPLSIDSNPLSDIIAASGNYPGF